MSERIVSTCLVGKGDGEYLIAVTDTGRVFSGRPSRPNPNQWHPTWSRIEWTENSIILKPEAP